MLRSTKTREPVANLLLAALPGKEYQRLRPHLELLSDQCTDLFFVAERRLSLGRR
jgi:hypothetical protein